MEWSAPVIVLQTRPFGEGDVVATVFGAEQGVWRGLARGGNGRRGAALWQRGNLLSVRWVARLADQLGGLTGEMVHPAGALAMEDALQLAILNAAAAVAEGALPEREPEPKVFAGLLDLIGHLSEGAAQLAALARWETIVLAALGYGLDLSRCAVSGTGEDLAFVSPRSGKAVSRAASAPWQGRLLPLPAFLLGPAPSSLAEWRDALALTGHFLARDVFGTRHKPLPPARLLLYDRVAALAADAESQCPT
ncbi:MAG TPA: DNA repair protein RecO [Acetobacteraceae bacterium]|jgi:DNA repair protein RecO (recombination protein O)|nr:DNA repair protein RecO [Acetobacteraceae bacterium]